MKRFILPLLLLSVFPAFAADTAPAPSATTCGKTAEDCQKIVDVLNDQIADLRAAYTLARQQRLNVQTALSDTEIQTAIQQQQAARAQSRQKLPAPAAAKAQ